MMTCTQCGQPYAPMIGPLFVNGRRVEQGPGACPDCQAQFFEELFKDTPPVVVTILLADPFRGKEHLCPGCGAVWDKGESIRHRPGCPANPQLN